MDSPEIVRTRNMRRAKKAADTRRRDRRMQLAQAKVGKRHQFVVTVFRRGLGVRVSIKMAPGWKAVPR